MGGAFLGRADDATAAFANPAGLTNLHTAEFSAEVRSWTFKHVFSDSGRLEGFEPLGQGIDIQPGIQQGESQNQVDGFPFLSYVYPGKRSWKRWRLAFYRHELANFEARFRTQGPFRNGSGGMGRIRPTEVDYDIYIANYGLSTAVAFGDALDPFLSLGVGFSRYEFSLNSVVHRFALEGKGGVFVGLPDYARSNREDSLVQEGDDSDTGVNFGFLWRVHKIFNFGGVYRQGPEFGSDLRRVPGPAGGQLEPLQTQPRFFIPDVLGLGVATVATNRTRITLDYYRTRYSVLTGSLEGSIEPKLADLFIADDADELHLGLEYEAPRHWRPLVALRLGVWNERDSRIRFEGPCEQVGKSLRDDCYRRQVQFRPGEDAQHYSGGIGLVFGGIELNVAVDFSERVDTLSVSTVYRPWQN